MLGKREPEIYGSESMEAYLNTLKNKFPDHTINYQQSNAEHDFIEYIHKSNTSHHALIINPGAFSHYSLAVSDAVKSINIPVIEVHISNIYAREFFRKTSFISPYSQGVISGLGLKGYELAVRAFTNI